MLRKNHTIVLLFVQAILVIACGGGSSGDIDVGGGMAVAGGVEDTGDTVDESDSTNNTGSADTGNSTTIEGDQSELQRELAWLYDKMKTEYLFYRETPDVDPTQFTSADELLQRMIVSEKDRFSYIQPLDDALNQLAAVSTTFGMATSRRNGVIKVRRVYDGSSASEAGILRADRIIRIGDVRVIDADTSDQAIDLLIDAVAGASVEIEFERENAALPFTAVLTRREVSRQTVDYADVIEKPDGSRTGYLVISEFRNKTKDELRRVFGAFGQAGITSLIVDLRGNGGGSLSTIGVLGSLILGDQPAGLPFIRFQYSDLGDAIFRNGDFRTGYDLTIEENATILQRVHVITSNWTCSASEVLVNSLRAYIDVQLTGVTTCGKPYGFYGRQFEEKSMLWAINFTSANASGEDDFTDGLAATCVIPDYEIYPYFDFRDQHLATAMNYLDSDSCQLPLANARQGMQARTEKTLFRPIWRLDDEGIEHFSY